MKRKNRNKKQGQDAKISGNKKSWHDDLQPETKKSIIAVLTFVMATLLVLSYIGRGGNVGGYIFKVLGFLFGRGYFFAPIGFVLVGVSLLFSEKKKIVAAAIMGGALFLLSSLAVFDIIFGSGTGGFLGKIISSPLFKLFDFWASLVITAGIFLVSILLMFNASLRFRREKDEEEKKEKEEESAGETLVDFTQALGKIFSQKKEEVSLMPSSAIMADESKNKGAEAAPVSSESDVLRNKEEALISLKKIAKKRAYTKPPLELLQGDRGTPSSGDIKANSNIIKRTLENFGVDVEMSEISIGPTVTQYTLRPAEGVKLSRVTALHNDLSLALAAHPIRIEAPIPGKSLVGIEVPNRSIALVGLRALLENKIFQESAQSLLFALGRDVSGMPVFADLSRMPHLLISGATGTGKSVMVHTIISSFLYRNHPDMLRFIMIDPKRVELSVYNDIPYLLTPVITESKKAILALHWATREMDKRYDMLLQYKVRDITSYNNQAIRSKEDELLPYIVIIIDELADLMAMYPREMEAAIIRLAQMARAVGIHLVVSTQRPSVEVITGLIKANITSRIAFQVASQIDSRTILDMAGAEKLLGNGDMLFLAGDTAKPRRIQGAFVTESEVKRVVDFIREEFEAPEYEEEILETKFEEGSGREIEDFFGDDDPLYEEAKTIVIEAGKASASYLQRRLRVGYARAARLLDLLEAKGVIGPGDGAKPREVFIKFNLGSEEREFDV